MTAGHSYTLTLSSHDDNYAGDPTYTLYDSVGVTTGGGGGGGITNGGFETGTLRRLDPGRRLHHHRDHGAHRGLLRPGGEHHPDQR